jgi:hypothetical protein
LGVRCIDRITGPEVDAIANLVRPEVRGIVGTSVATQAVHAISESLFDLTDARMLARWGCLPPGLTVDPSAIEPAAEKSWILDLDMFSVAPMPFAVDRVISEAQRYFFWFVREEEEVLFEGTGWSDLLSRWLKLIPPGGRFKAVDGPSRHPGGHDREGLRRA